MQAVHHPLAEARDDPGPHIPQALLHVAQHIFGLPLHAAVLRLAQTPVVMLQLALQLGDARRRLLVIFLKHLRMEAL